jgi:hypothetical protein
MTLSTNIKAEVYNFRGIKEAQIDLSGIALITGSNYSGKTSIARGIASAVTREQAFNGLTKKQVEKLVNRESTTGSVRITTDAGTIMGAWPKGEFSTGGDPTLSASLYATGLSNILEDDNKTRSKFFIGLLKAEPTEDDLTNALRTHMIEPEQINKIWSDIEQHNWDAACDEHKESARDKKAEWKVITGQQYGKDKAKEWHPDIWNESLEYSTTEQLQERCAMTQKDYESALSSQSIAGHELESLKEKKAQLPTLQEELKTHQEELEVATMEIDSLTKMLGDSDITSQNSIPCPECGTHPVPQRGNDGLTLIKADTLSEEEQQEKQAERERLEKSINKYTQEKRNHESAIAKVELAIEQAQDAEKQIAEAESKQGNSDADIDTIRKNLELAKGKLLAFETWHKAHALHKEIELIGIISDILSETGLRKQKLGTAIEHFNTNVLAPLTEKFGIMPIILDHDLNVHYNNVPYHQKDPDYLLSKCEQFMIRTALQAAIAMLDNSDIMIVDNADELNSLKDKAGLINMVMSTGLPTLICMALQPENTLADLERHGVGHSYIIKDGKTWAPADLGYMTDDKGIAHPKTAASNAKAA